MKRVSLQALAAANWLRWKVASGCRNQNIRSAV
jgi:hypothetical protein